MVTQAGKSGSKGFHSNINSAAFHVRKMSMKEFASYGVGKCLQTAEALSDECKILSVVLQIIIKINVTNQGMWIPCGSGIGLGQHQRASLPGPSMSHLNQPSSGEPTGTFMGDRGAPGGGFSAGSLLKPCIFSLCSPLQGADINW